MRITRFVVLGLLLAACASAVALAVDKQGSAAQTSKEDEPEPTVTVKGVLHTTGNGYAVGSRSVSFGPPWYAAHSPLIKDRLGTSVTVTGSTDDGEDELSVRTIDGVIYRAAGRPPWAGGPKHGGTSATSCKAKAKAKAAKAKAKDDKDADDKTEKAGDANGGPPPWARAYGRRCKS